jgi:hypothetical protein
VGVDARADVYATGMLLYTLLAGRSPFTGLTGLDLLQAHLSRPPEPLSHRPGLHIVPALDAAVLRALAKSPDDRYATAADFSGELLGVLEILPPGAPSRPSLTARGTERLAAMPDLARLKAAHAARRGTEVKGGEAAAGEHGARAAAEPNDPRIIVETPGKTAEQRAFRRRDLGVVLALLATSALVFWLLFVAGARLVGWR